jgi:putative ABC transport system substrate-binding protein
MAYGPNDTDCCRIAAEIVDNFLRGARPAEPPIQQPTKWELVISLQIAKALGIPVPKALLQQADRLIE